MNRSQDAAGQTIPSAPIQDPPLARAEGREPLRRRAVRALVIGALLVGAGAALAQPQRGGRMDPGERERLRRELRQQDEQGRRGDERARGRQQLSPQEREELRRQLRQARPPEAPRGRGRRRD